MASAATPSVASTRETTNYARLCRLLVDVGSQALRDTFDGIYPPAGLHTVLARNLIHKTLQSLTKRKILNPTQWGHLYPTTPLSASSASFDITLLMVLLRNICGLIPPVTGWDSLPPPNDASKEANIVRVKYYRNTVYSHASQASVDDATFNTYWQDISNALVALGGASYGAAINKLKNECMDPDTEEHYRELLKQWKKDEDSIKDKLEEIEELLKKLKKEKGDIESKLGEVEENIKAKIEEMGNQVKSATEKLDSSTRSSQNEDKIRNDLQELKSEIRNIRSKLDTLMTQREDNKDEDQARGDFQQMRNEIRNISEKLNTQISSREGSKDKDVFDPAEITDGIRELYKLREGWLAPFPWCEEFHFHLDDIFTRLKVVSKKKTRGTATTDTVDMSGIFKPHEESPQPRTVLIEGKPGMGKTTYCKKLVYDWATGKQEAEDRFPKFETVLLLRCRDMKSDLWEAIDDQLLPRDIKEDKKDRFFDFIRHNQSNVLLILDGLDEVPANKLPMFSEIIQGRVLPKCRLVATARHEAGIKVRIHCDTLLEIEGFTEQDAQSFIVKYFKTMEHLAQKLLFKLGGDANLKEMIANPLNTSLLCLFCEEFEGVFPESKAKLYLEIVECVLRRYIQKKELSEKNEDLVEAYKPQLKHLGCIALKGLREDKLDFDERELGSHTADLPGFGFLSVQLGGSKLRPRRRYGFLHKSFQEFFAAFYLYCQLLDKEISADSLTADRKYFHELKEVLKFLCGMLAARCEETAATVLVQSITTQVNNEDDDDSFEVLLECIKECKKDNSNFETKLARVFGSFLTLRTLTISISVSEAHVAILAEALKQNTSVTRLDLSNNYVDDQGAASLAEALKENPSLKRLNLSSNSIHDQGAACLAEALKENPSLKRLNLSSNSIGDQGAACLAEALEENVLINLKRLDFANNYIHYEGAAALGKALKRSSNLARLDWATNLIGDHGAVGLAETLKGCRDLTHLNLSKNQIGNHGAAVLGIALEESTSLVRLDWSDNLIGDHGAVGLAEALKGCRDLTHLNLSKNRIGNHGAAVLGKALEESTSLVRLDWSDNLIVDHGAAGLAEVLKGCRDLTHLNLSKNHIGNEGAAVLGNALGESTSLVRLDWSDNLIGDHGAAGLAEALKGCRDLTHLNLSKNQIGSHGAAVLGKALKEIPWLKRLDCSDNLIGDHGAAGLAEGFQEREQLTHLYLSKNRIGDQGAAVLAKALKEIPWLKRLDCSDNLIGDHGAAGLAEGLQGREQLTHLNLSKNRIGDQGAAALGKALEGSTSLMRLDLADNLIGDHGAACLAETLKENTRLTVLDLFRNQIGEAVISELHRLEHDSRSILLREESVPHYDPESDSTSGSEPELESDSNSDSESDSDTDSD